jgi:hypothetical protein
MQVTAMRERLPSRRMHELLDFAHGGFKFTAGLGRFTDGRLAEVFLNAAKVGTAVEAQARDAAVVVSLALQHGCQVDAIKHALARNADGSAASPIGALLDILGGGHDDGGEAV